MSTTQFTLTGTPQLVATVNKPGQALLQCPAAFLVNDDGSANGISVAVGSDLELTYPVAHPGADPGTVHPATWYAWAATGSPVLTVIVEDV